ncbi:MAG: two-component system copper resistance phosphate regulon response regulator CusR [Candidatus Paceibacteria bacterium]|jgi:two-component system copper resistance phosphate regulon response regulator CusR
MVRILVVDDDPKFRKFLCEGLAAYGMDTSEAANGEAALEALMGVDPNPFDLLLLDVMMPGASGWDVLEAIREQENEIPTIFLTARDAVEDRVRGLELGADDYIIKPFEFTELLARIDAVIRRRESVPVLTFGPLHIDLGQREVTIEGKLHELSTKEYDLLLALVREKGKVTSRVKLLKDVWGIDFDPETNLVDVFIARLRRRLQPHGTRLIRTVRGEGYQLVDLAHE